jgi:hypothetical protein
MTKEQMRQVLLSGYCTAEVEIGETKYVFRTLRGKDVFAASVVREAYITTRPQTTVDTFMSLDTAIKLALALVSVNNQPWQTLSEEEINYLLKSGFKKQEDARYDEIISKAVEATLKVLDMAPQVIQKLSGEFNKLNEELQKAIENGEIEKN